MACNLKYISLLPVKRNWMNPVGPVGVGQSAALKLICHKPLPLWGGRRAKSPKMNLKNKYGVRKKQTHRGTVGLSQCIFNWTKNYAAVWRRFVQRIQNYWSAKVNVVNTLIQWIILVDNYSFQISFDRWWAGKICSSWFTTTNYFKAHPTTERGLEVVLRRSNMDYPRCFSNRWWQVHRTCVFSSVSIFCLEGPIKEK